MTDTAARDAGNIVAAGNLITDGCDNGGDCSVTLTVTDVNGSPDRRTSPEPTAHLLVDSNGTYIYTANTAVDQMQVGDSRPSPSTSPSPTVSAAASDHADAQRHRRRRRAGDHRGRHQRLHDGRCRADGRRQWRLRDRRSHRLDRTAIPPSNLFLGGEFGNYRRTSTSRRAGAEHRDDARSALYGELLRAGRHRSQHTS